MKKPHGKIGFNQEYLKRIGKQVFIDAHKEVYPGYDLGAAWDEANPKPKQDKKAKEE